MNRVMDPPTYNILEAWPPMFCVISHHHMSTSPPHVLHILPQLLHYSTITPHVNSTKSGQPGVSHARIQVDFLKRWIKIQWK